MICKILNWLVVGILMLGSVFMLNSQRREAAVLEREIILLHDEIGERGRLEAEQARLRTAQPSDAELASLREDRSALNRLRTELDAVAASSDRGNESAMIPASAWKLAGRATPEAALETVLWAELNGNMDTIAAAVTFESDAARAQAVDLMASLPAELQSHHDSPERLIAFLMSRGTRYDSMRVLQQVPEPDAETSRALNLNPGGLTDIVFVQAELQIGNEPPKNKVLLMQRGLDGWKLVVPATAVETYAEKLKEAVTQP